MKPIRIPLFGGQLSSGMPSLLVRLVLAFATTGSAALVRAAESPISPKPTIVLVHGAFADSSSWNAVITKLLAHGYPVVAVANPLRGLRTDADYVSRVFQTIPGPVIAVGHSYAGSVITNAAVGNANVAALVHVAGFAPDVGETAFDLSGRFPGSTLGAALAPPVTLPGGDKDLYILQDRFPAQFARDVPEREARVMAAAQRPIAESALKEPAAQPAWKSIPSWFIFGSLDKNIPEAALLFMANRANARETINVKGASHVVMISHPDAVVKLIEKAAASAAKKPVVAAAGQ